MTTKILPVFKQGQDIWSELSIFLDTVQPGDVVQNPTPDANWRCNYPVQFPHKNVKFNWEGAQFYQTSLRPFGQIRSDVTITNGTHLFIPSGSPLIPAQCNWGYVTGPDIPDGTHIQLDYNRRDGILDNVCDPGSGITVTFTAKKDRERCGFNFPGGKDQEHHDLVWWGSVNQPKYTRYLEAQCGYNFAGASGIDMYEASARNMQGDFAYFTSNGGVVTSDVHFIGGKSDYNARSFIVPANCRSVTVEHFNIDHVGRTVVDFEPPNSACVALNTILRDSVIGRHQLTLMSSGGNDDANIGRVELSKNLMINDDSPLWLVEGNAAHPRGPFIITENETNWPHGFGATYPQPALIAIDNARTGSKVIDNKGFKLQPGRNMALVRSRRSGTVEVHGNDHDGGIEVGPWV